MWKVSPAMQRKGEFQTFRISPQKRARSDLVLLFWSIVQPSLFLDCTSVLPRPLPPLDIRPLRVYEHFLPPSVSCHDLFHLAQVPPPTPSSPRCPSAAPLHLTKAKAQGVKFNSSVAVSQAQARTNLHGCIHVLALRLFSDSPPPTYTHKHV